MSEFIQRHIGPSESEQRKMLADLGLSTIDELVREIVPDSILLRGDSNLPEGCSEQEALAELKDIASHNIVKRSLIGQGYYGTCLLYTSPSPRDNLPSRMPSSA